MQPPGVHAYAFEAGHVLCERFEILGPLGYGGVGEVYHARDRALNEEVALKIVMCSSLRALQLERVRREVAIARGLCHPNILKYFDLHEFGRGLALSMERVRGRTLQDLLEREGPLGEKTIRAILPQIVEAMEHLHANGIIHRDIKPSNIFIGDDGTVKLGDFGIVHTEGTEGLTLTGEAIGTPTYMSPEQIQGRNLTPAADYYSLGITLYELASGRVPFEGTYGEVASAHLHQPPSAPPVECLSGGLKRLIAGLLEKDPGRRWTGAPVRLFLERKRLPLLPGRGRTIGMVSGAILLLAASLFLGMRWWAWKEPTRVVVEGRHVLCLSHGKPLWSKEFAHAISGNVLLDVDGDGALEVVLAQTQRIMPGQAEVRIPAFRANGEEAPPLRLPLGEFPAAFSAFSPNYQVLLEKRPFFSPGKDDLVIHLRHELFFPDRFSVWSPESGSEALRVGHAGWIMQAKRWKDGVAFWGGNASLLHMMCLGITNPCGPGVPPLNAMIGPSPDGTDRLRAYYLVENFNSAQADFSGDITVTLSDGTHRLLGDGRLEGMRPGAPGQSIKGLYAFAQVRAHLRNGRFAEAGDLIAQTRHECRAYGLTGHAVLCDGLDSERLARQGRWDEAVRLCSETASRYPAYAHEFPLLAGFHRYLQGEFPEAREIWLGNPATIHVGANKQWEAYTYAVYTSLLSGAAPETLRDEISTYQNNIPEDNYWRRYLDVQKGWIPLLHGDFDAAASALKPALDEGGYEHHAAGYFLARVLAGTYDPAELEGYAGKRGGNPLYLQWVAALGTGDREGARRLWSALEREAWESQDTALMVPVMRKMKRWGIGTITNL